jgi:SHOCT-like domain
MPDDALARILQMVADGRMSAAEAAPIIDALDARRSTEGPADRSFEDDQPAKVLRVVVTEAGRPVVNLNIPLSLGRAAISRLPGLSGTTSDLIRQAIDAGQKASIVDIDDGGDGVRISIE